MTIKAHKIRLLSTPNQEIHFAKAAGIARYSYNWGLARWKENLETKTKTNWRDLRKAFNHEVKPQHEWLKEVTKCAPAMAFHDLGEGMKNHFDSKNGKRKGRKVSFPVFKKKNRSKDSFSIESDKVKLSESRDAIHVPRLGLVKMAEKLRFDGRIGNVRISRKAGKWFVSIPVEFEEKGHTLQKNHSVGIDFGLKTSLALSDGRCFQSPKALPKLEVKLKKLARRKSKKIKSSHNRKKAILKESRLHSRIANLRNDWQHKVTTQIASTHRNIFVENLNVSGMIKNHRLAKHIADASFYELKRKLNYKASDRKGAQYEIDTFFPSSKLCRMCGTKKAILKLSERVFQCENQTCKHVEDRDLHASKNILAEGQRLLKCEKTVNLPSAGGKVKPVEKRASARSFSNGQVSMLVEAGRAQAHRKNLPRHDQTDQKFF